MDKYFQIAPCFRDEDPRADRHSCEFYQIDCEMSFVEQDDIFQVAESFVTQLISQEAPEKNILDLTGTSRFHQLTHKQAKDLYGTDKPDLRFDLKFVDCSDSFAQSGFSVFSDAIAQS